VTAWPVCEQPVPKFVCDQTEYDPLISLYKNHIESKEHELYHTTDVYAQSSVPEDVLSLFCTIRVTKHAFVQYCTSFDVAL